MAQTRTKRAPPPSLTSVPVESLPTIRVGNLVFVPSGPALRVPTEQKARLDSDAFFASLVSWVMTDRDPPALPLSEDTKPDDLRRAREIFHRIAMGLFAGNPDVLHKLRAIEVLLADLPTNDTEQLAFYRRRFEIFEAVYRDVKAGIWKDEEPDDLLLKVVRTFAGAFDKAFERLTVGQLRKAFESVSAKRGPGEIGALRAAAEVAVHVGAFATGGPADFETKVTRLMSRMRKATNEAQKMAAKKKAPPRKG